MQDGSVCITDLRSHELIRRCQVAEKDVAVPSIALNPVNENQLFCCVGASVLGIDVRQVNKLDSMTLVQYTFHYIWNA